MEVYEDEKSRFNQNIPHFAMETDDVKPGFTQLRLEYNINQFSFEQCEEHNGKHYYSSALCKQRLMVIGAHTHGPCITDKRELTDSAWCLHCKTWVSPAVQWITRTSNSWPCDSVKQNQISNFDESLCNFLFEPQLTLYANDVEKILKSKLSVNANLISNTYISVATIKTSNIHKEKIIQTVLSHQSSIKYLCKYCMSMWYNLFAQNIPLNSTNNYNKYSYKQYKFCLSTLLQNVHHDAVSGWLMLASLFYKTKQYNKALHIIRYSMSKCTPEKLYRHMSMSDIHYQLLKLQSFQRKSLMNLKRTMFVDCINFTLFSTLTPDELQMDESNELFYFPYAAYAYFLNFLCHYHLKNVRQYEDSLQGLQLVIKENYLIGGRDSEDSMLLRIALQVLDDNKFA
ncbi:unnamed protein product [Mytilus coruscus]|uniref:Uncharacterized protein n=1 Tax=Mytilus coruscus TaxID=42192 RepID=A0A6J7ZV96_MYTCO|nr:unnamed protein product [Mytilus coruscus]